MPMAHEIGTAGVSANGGTVVACASLKESSVPVAEWLQYLAIGCRFSDDVHLAVGQHDPRLTVLPVFTVPQAQRLASLTEQHPGASVVGVVMDMTGHHTHRAIEHGATWVLNALLPPASCMNMLRMVVEAVIPGGRTASLSERCPASPGLAYRAVPVRTNRAGPIRLETAPDTAADAGVSPGIRPAWQSDEAEKELLELLSGPAPISEIAKRFYCSERSMYRQLRSLYARYGVEGRQQLRRALALPAGPGRRRGTDLHGECP